MHHFNAFGPLASNPRRCAGLEHCRAVAVHTLMVARPTRIMILYVVATGGQPVCGKLPDSCHRYAWYTWWYTWYTWYALPRYPTPSTLQKYSTVVVDNGRLWYGLESLGHDALFLMAPKYRISFCPNRAVSSGVSAAGSCGPHPSSCWPCFACTDRCLTSKQGAASKVSV